jgi:phosphatidylglycerol:prolipoprotein diacylglycerol transferase
MDPVAVQIGPLAIHWYGLILMGGALAGATVAARLAKAAGDNPEHLWNALTWCLLLGIVGARLYHIVSSPQGTDVGLRYYLQNPHRRSHGPAPVRAQGGRRRGASSEAR